MTTHTTERRNAFGYISALAALLCAFGCAIEELPGGGAPHGTLFVATFDEADAPLPGGTVYIDGTPRTEPTPAYYHGVPEGSRQVVVKRFGFIPDTEAVEIIPGDTVALEATLRGIPEGRTGRLVINSQPGYARLLIDGRTHPEPETPLYTPLAIDLPWGLYRVSVHLAGHATTAPLLPRVALNAGDTLALSFTLEEREAALQAGGLPFDFTLETLQGDSVRLTDLTGYVVLLNFWYADCAPCLSEFPGIETVYQQYAPSDLRVLAVNPMFPDDREEVARIRDALGLTFKLLLDWGRHVTAELYRVNIFPRNVLIDRSGTIRAVMQAVEVEELEGLIEPLLAEGR